MSDPDHASLREKFVAVFQTVLSSVGGQESLGLLLTSLEACLTNDAVVFVSVMVESSEERRRCRQFTAWVFAQLVVIHGDTPPGETRARATAFAGRLLRTLHARDPALLAGAVLDVWLATLRQLTADGGAALRLLDETWLPAVAKTPPPGPEAARFRRGVLQFVLSDAVTRLLVVAPAQLDEAVSSLTRLGRTEACGDALRAVIALLGPRPASVRHRLLLSRLERPPPPPPPPPPTPPDLTRLPAADWRRAVTSLAEQAGRMTSLEPAAAAAQAILQMLSKIGSCSVEDFPAIYRHTLEAAAALLEWPLDVSVQGVLATLVSLPWLGAEVNWYDLQLTLGEAPIRGQLEAIIGRLGPISTSDLAEDCLRVLVIFPRNVCPLWRFQLVQRLSAECDVTAALLPAAAVSLSRAAAAHLLALTSAVTSGGQLAPLGRLLCLAAGRASFSRAPDQGDGLGCWHLLVSCELCGAGAGPDRPAALQPFSDPTVPPGDVIGVIVAAVTSWRGAVTSEECSALIGCLNHATDRTAVVRTVLELPTAADWSLALRHVLAGDADWQPAQTPVCDWLLALEEAESARMFQSLLFESSSPQRTGHRTAPLSPELVSRLLCGLQRLLVSAQPAVAASAHLSLHRLARRLRLSLAAVWQRHRAAVCAALARRLLEEAAPLSRLAAAAAAWEWRGLDGLLRVGRRHLLPPLVVAMATERRADLLDAAAAVLKTKPKDLLIDNYHYVASHLVLSGRRADLSRVHAFIASATGVQIEEIRRCSVQGQVNELLLGLHSHRDDVIRELGCLVRLDGAAKPNDCPVPLNDVIRYVSDRLLGVLGWADSRLSSEATPEQEKRELLLSIADLCHLLGRSHVSPVSRKLLATLKTGLSVPGEQRSAVWLALVRTLDAEALRALAAELLVTLAPLPAADREPALRCLLSEREDDIRPVLDELPEVPSAAQYGCALSLRASQAPLVDRLSRAVRSLAHHSLLVRQHVLLRLRDLLLQQRAQVSQMITSPESCSTIISQLIDTLLMACRGADSDTQRLVAECLGSLGAIDPARLVTPDHVVSSARPPPPPAVSSHQFAAALLTQLGRAFTAASDGTTQACAAFAMQEALKIYGISGGTGAPLWESLSGELRQLLAPMRTSKYQLSASRGQSPPTPVYGNAAIGAGHSDWIGLWLTQLAGFVTQRQAALVFAAAKPIACRDLTLATFLLPHVFTSAIIDGGSAAQCSALAEIEAVLKDKRPAPAESSGSELYRLCCRSVFSVLDAAAGWLVARRAECGGSSRQLEMLRTDDAAYRAVAAFVAQVPFDVVAEACRLCGDQKRALQAMEEHIRRHPDQLTGRLPFLQDLYVSLSEPDGVAGVFALRAEAPSVADQLILYESKGQTHHALSCYEHICNTPGSELAGYRGLISCYLNLDQPNTALSLARDMIGRNAGWEEEFSESLVEATWRLGRWQELEPALEAVPLDCWGAAVGATLLHADKRRSADFEKMLSFCREQEMAPLSAAALENGSYTRVYEHLVRLHVLSDLERSLPGLLWTEAESGVAAELSEWQRRLDTLRPSVSTLEPVLTARRAVLTLARDRLRGRGSPAADVLDLEVGRCWLRSARTSRKAGHLQRAANCLLQLERLERRLPEAFVERASLLWRRGEGAGAIRALRQGIESHFPDWAAKVKAGRLTASERQILAEAKLLLARYCEESANMDSNVINQHFVEITEIRKDWEDVHFYTAKYLDRLLAALPAGGRDSSQLGPRVVHALGKSLQYGCRHVYESMPRLLSIWLDYGAPDGGGAKPRQSDAALVAKNVELMCRRLAQLLETLPLYCFLTSLPQLISRICHGRAEVYAQLRDILAALLATYPKQCMWYMLAVSRSSYPMRVERCQDVFARARARKPALAQFISDATKLADKLIDLSNKPVEKKTNRVSLTSFFPSIRRLVSSGFSPILVPLQQQMTVTLPETAAQHGFQFRPFPESQVCIAGFEDDVEVMPSLVKPKKITLRGTDGKKYTMMAKPKDDLRKDSRLMEFNSLVNRHLAQHGEARERNLRIRTYTVIPLNDECGLLQWVPNLSGMRQVLLAQYRQLGGMMTNAELKQTSAQLEDSLERKRAIFTEKLLPRHPAVLSRWFLDTFPDPQAWYAARLSFARTAAVMSMIGYILGLGDRHGENILLDSSNGDCVHVDFNCLFNKGELFDWPERVPFRLTHNMVDALGPTGVEGVYRTSCEVTMSVMRQQQDALMCVLRPFVHDPLVEWSKQERKTRDVGEIVNEKAQAHVGDIEQRLQGQVRSKLKPVPIPLSVPGQVNYLIEEATSVDNLCQMYIGWAAHF